MNKNNFRYEIFEEKLITLEEMKNGFSKDYAICKTGKSSEIVPKYELTNMRCKFEPFKFLNKKKHKEEEENKKEKQYIQTCIDNKIFNEKLIENTPINYYQFITGNPSSRKPDEKGNGIFENSKFIVDKDYEEIFHNKLIKGVNEISKPSLWEVKYDKNRNEIINAPKRYLECLYSALRDSICDLRNSKTKNELRQTIQLWEGDFFIDCVFSGALTVKESSVEPTPFTCAIHTLSTVFSEPKVFKSGTKNSKDEFYKIKIEFEKEHNISFKGLVNEYLDFVKEAYGKEYLTKYVEDIRKLIGFKKTKGIKLQELKLD